ncbi:ABC transporter ATP-binding protein [Micrococcoides hystricis]|uniref:ABC transporter ATP-binding protein n=1 Tax=Micrococcoides hystricis TaxID=1572761 RepID=A0ABV6PBU6_9MICC
MTHPSFPHEGSGQEHHPQPPAQPPAGNPANAPQYGAPQYGEQQFAHQQGQRQRGMQQSGGAPAESYVQPGLNLGQLNPDAAISVRGLTQDFGQHRAVDNLNWDVPRGSFYGLVGPNGAGKTTALSMLTGLLRPTYGGAMVAGVDVWADPLKAKATMGVLADGVFLFDRLTGAQLITYAGLLRGLDRHVVDQRCEDLLRVMDLTEAKDKVVADYSAGMTKKVALAASMIHSPRVLILDEPFEAVDPVSAANIRDILAKYVAGGGTVVVSSHVMDLVQRMCDHVAVISQGKLLAAGTVDEVRGGQSLEDRFVDLVGGRSSGEGLAWLDH